MKLADNETAAIARAADRLERLRDFLHAHQLPGADAPAQSWFAYLAEVKGILGNFNNDLSLVSCLLAKEYLSNRFSLVPFDVAAKPQGANGLDIDARTPAGERIIGEIKTTVPYKQSGLGAQQITSLRKDFAKLQLHQADHTFMFVTDQAAFDALRRSFTSELQGVEVVCLGSGEEFSCPHIDQFEEDEKATTEESEPASFTHQV